MSICVKKSRLWFSRLCCSATVLSMFLFGCSDGTSANAESEGQSSNQQGAHQSGGPNNWNNGSNNNYVPPDILTEEAFVEDSSTVSDANQMPPCTAANEGEALMVSSENTPYFCLGGTWYNNVVETVGVSCQDGELIAGATVDVSPMDPLQMGVGTDSVVVFRRQGVAIAGLAEKGPFRHGASVSVVELDSVMRLADSPRIHKTCITSADGRYSFEPLDLVSPYVRVDVNGFYRNELNGGLSAEPVILSAVTDLTERDSVNVNMLTHLEGPRTLKMVENTGNNQPIRMMKEQALKDILFSFDIQIPGFNEQNGGQPNNWQQGGIIADDISLFDDGDFSAALIAVSVMMQRMGTGSKMMEYAGSIAERIKGNGNWDDFTAKADLADWLMVLDTSGTYNVIRKNLESLTQKPVPNFEKYLQNFWTRTYQFPACEGAALGTVSHIGNSLSAFFVSYYYDPNGSRTRFICDPQTGSWRTATDIEKDTVGLGADSSKYDGAFRQGAINLDRSYIYVESTNTWRPATSDDIMEFSSVEDVYRGLASDEKVVFVLRHAERTDDTGKNGHLTEDGKKQAQSVGAMVKNAGNFFLGYSGYTRTRETCENIALGGGQSNVSPVLIEALDGDWYVKDESRYNSYKASDGGSLNVYTRYVYRDMYSDAFYDLKQRSEEFVSKAIMANRASLQKVNFMISHDMMVLPFAVHVSGKKVNLRYFENRNWLNFLAGVAVIINSAGQVRYVPVKGLDSGSMII